MIDIPTFLACIALVETGGNDNAIGRAGERSQYQITAGVWRQHRGATSFAYCIGSSADECAARHAQWLIRHLPRHADNPEVLAYAWHRGLAAAKRQGPAAIAKINYAQRVGNLYRERLYGTRRP